MLYQLPDGRTIELSIYEYLEISDEELRNLVGSYDGVEINNPTYGSSITKTGRSEPEDQNYSGQEIPDVPTDERLKDQDYTPDE